MSKVISVFLLPVFMVCSFMFYGCNNNRGETYRGQISNVEADSVTNYWVEYAQGTTNHPLYTIAKLTKDETTYYYLEFGNNGNLDEMLIKLDNNGHYKVYVWDYSTSQWFPRTNETHPECGEGNDWFMFKTQFYSDYFSMALVGLQYSGEVNSLIRHENGTEVKNMGESVWRTQGYPYPNYLLDPVVVAPEDIQGCLHFYDEQENRHYYFAPDTHFLLHLDSTGLGYSCTTKVYKRAFDLNFVLSIHERTTLGLPFTLPSCV